MLSGSGFSVFLRACTILNQSENLTPQPRNPRKGRGSLKAPLLLGEGLGRGQTHQLIRQQYPKRGGVIDLLR